MDGGIRKILNAVEPIKIFAFSSSLRFYAAVARDTKVSSSESDEKSARASNDGATSPPETKLDSSDDSKKPPPDREKELMDAFEKLQQTQKETQVRKVSEEQPFRVLDGILCFLE